MPHNSQSKRSGLKRARFHDYETQDGMVVRGCDGCGVFVIRSDKVFRANNAHDPAQAQTAAFCEAIRI
jgi:hypothetical protein